MELRLATPKDFESFFPIKEEFLKDYNIPGKSRDFILKEFKDYLLKGAIVLAVKNKKIIGYLAGIIEKDFYEKYGYISEIFVSREYRNKGLSTQLKNKFVDFLKTRDINICRIDVNPDNPAKELYEKWGFNINKYRMSLKF